MSTRRAQTSANADPVRLRSPDPDIIHKLMGTFLSKDTSMAKFSQRSDLYKIREVARNGQTENARYYSVSGKKTQMFFVISPTKVRGC